MLDHNERSNEAIEFRHYCLALNKLSSNYQRNVLSRCVGRLGFVSVSSRAPYAEYEFQT
jgi:hypothetical protein